MQYLIISKYRIKKYKTFKSVKEMFQKIYINKGDI